MKRANIDMRSDDIELVPVDQMSQNFAISNSTYSRE